MQTVWQERIAVVGCGADHMESVAGQANKRSQRIITGVAMRAIELLIRITIAMLVFRQCKSPLKCVAILKALDSHRKSYLGEHRVRKIVRVSNRFYWDLYVPGWPSVAFNRFITGEIKRIAKTSVKANRFTNVFVAITKKCPLQCEHCFEWNALNKKEKLTLEDIKSIISGLQEKGTGQIQLTGGEPMLRANDIIELLRTAKEGTEFWLLTSGFGLTAEKAKHLRDAGLTGVVVSIDHFDPAMHNQFRRYEQSFEWAAAAVQNAIDAGLVAALSLCATKSFVSTANLMAYASMAKLMGVSIIQVLEPKAVGHYQGQDVLLKPTHLRLLEDFYLEMNRSPAFADFPIVNYHGYHHRRIGCMAAGSRLMYIDTDGDVHACPFCQQKCGSAIGDALDASIEQLQRRGCHTFQNATI
jgi:MoaA/NifB/PqqE/SkfB family radical SAM enzyme